MDKVMITVYKSTHMGQHVCQQTFVILKFVFHASVIYLTKDVIKLVDSTIYSFIWKAKDMTIKAAV